MLFALVVFHLHDRPTSAAPAVGFPDLPLGLRERGALQS
jgi:hypothetical protein